MLFTDRSDAGRQLAAALAKYSGKKDVIVLALPRGGLPVGFEIASVLRVPLSIVVSKKIPFPGNEELAIGAVSNDGAVYVDKETIASYGIPQNYLEEQKARLAKVVEEKFRRYAGSDKKPDLKGRIVILTDDGLATGSTMFAAIEYVRSKKPDKIIVAIPVAPSVARSSLERRADEVICLGYEESFFAVGQFYREFDQVEDDEAIGYLVRAREAAR